MTNSATFGHIYRRITPIMRTYQKDGLFVVLKTLCGFRMVSLFKAQNIEKMECAL